MAQSVFAVIIAAIVYRWNATVTQGLLIGMSLVLVSFTVLCFGAAASG